MRARKLFGVLATAVAALASAAAANGAAHTTGPLVQVAGPSPFGSCVETLPGNALNTVVEPSVAVNAANPSIAVAAWQQDRWGDPNQGGAHSLLSAATSNGGASWPAIGIPPFTTCAGGTAANNGNWDRASDPWVSIAPNGDAYHVALVFNWFDGRSAVTISKSTDAGVTWTDPAYVGNYRNNSFTMGADKESVTADPTMPGYVYVVWDKYSNQAGQYHDHGNGANASKGPAVLSRSTDGGQTWSNPQAIYSRNDGTLDNDILVLPNGTLLDFFVDFVVKSGSKNPEVFNGYISFVSSTDHGKTWSQTATRVSPAPISCTEAVDPDNPGVFTRSGCTVPSFAVDPHTGALYVVWQDNSFSGGQVDQVAFTKSTDGGAHWSMPVKISQTPSSGPIVDQQAFTPTVAVNSTGAIGVTYYDNRNDNPVTHNSTDYWGITSTDGGVSWTETRLTNSSFNISHAPTAGGCCFLGDYEGLAAAGSAFQAAFVVADNTSSPVTYLDARRFAP
jgi:hypothetical protein